MGEFAAIDVGFPEHQKVSGLHDRAFRFHVTALCYCARNLTDGHVSARGVKVIAAILDTSPKRWTKELVDAKLWRRDEAGDGFWIHDYLVNNPRAEAIKDLRDKRRQAGIRGAEKRWAGREKKDQPTPGSLASDGNSHSKCHSKSHIPAEQSSSSCSSDASGRQFRARDSDDEEGLPFANEILTARLLSRIGDHADSGTRHVVRSYASRLPEAAVAKVVESIELNHPTDRAAYAVAALRSELEERRLTA